MKILVLNGSPRVTGNTAHVINLFKNKVEESGHEVKIIQVGRKKIHDCIDCRHCFSHQQQCCQKDDMFEVYEALKEYDALVFASPIYYYSWTGAMQCCMDRFYAVGRNVKAKCCALLLTSGSDNVYEAIETQFNNIMHYMRLEVKGIVKMFGIDVDQQENLDKYTRQINELANKF